MQLFRLGQIGLGQSNQPASDAEQPANIEMFPSLRLDGLVRRDHQQNRFDAARTREHVFDEALMTRYIDKADAFAAGKRNMREAEIYGNAAHFLFRQAIGIDAGQSPDE